MSEEVPKVVKFGPVGDKSPLIRIHARKWFPIKAGMFSPVTAHVRAVDGVDLEINRGGTWGSGRIRLWKNNPWPTCHGSYS